jgi:hypothetical protein
MSSPKGHTQSQRELAFFRSVRQLHRRAGEPSSRAIAGKVGDMSHTTVNLALRGPKVPSWPVVAKVVNALGGDVEEFRQVWLDAQEPVEMITTADESEVQVFVSYARIDDEATYGRISKLVEDIARTYQSMTGKTVGVFKDVESIRPGEDWRDRIRAGLSYSSIFLAFITPAYLRSPNCREELSEFLTFLTSSSVERLVIPLIYTKRERIEGTFAEDELWVKLDKRQGPDISNLRRVEPGSPDWIEKVENLADAIDEILSSFRHVEETPQRGRKPAANLSDSTPPGTLERMASLEEQIPEVIGDMTLVTQLLEATGVAVTAAAPRLTSAQTFGARLAVSRELAKELDPISEELMSAAERLASNFGQWDFFVKYFLDYARSGGDLKATEVAAGLKSLWMLATTGASSLAQASDFAQIVSQGLGVSRDLDRPFMAIRDASLRIADISGILDGWREILGTLEAEYLGDGYLDSLPEPNA